MQLLHDLEKWIAVLDHGLDTWWFKLDCSIPLFHSLQPWCTGVKFQALDMGCKSVSARLDHCHAHGVVVMDHNLEICWTVPSPWRNVGAGLELYVVVLVHSQWPKWDCDCTGQCVNYPLLALSWALFERKVEESLHSNSYQRLRKLDNGNPQWPTYQQ